MPEPMPEKSPSAPYRPIAIGFVLLSLPLWIAVLLAENAAGAWTNAVAAATMMGLGALVMGWRGARR